MVYVTLFHPLGGKKKENIFRRSEIQTCSMLQCLLWLRLGSEEGSVGGAGSLLTQCTCKPNIHTGTHTLILPLLRLLVVWLRGGGGDWGLSSDTAGGDGDACPLNHQPREPLALKKNAFMCPAGPYIYVCFSITVCILSFAFVLVNFYFTQSATYYILKN